MNDSQLTGTLNVTNTNEEPGQRLSNMLTEARAHILELSGCFSQSLLLLGDQKSRVEAIFIEPSLTFHMLRQCSECLTCIDLLSIHKSSLHIFF